MNNNSINIIVLASNLKIIKIESTPTRTSSSCAGVSEFSTGMVWHLHIGTKMSTQETPEVLTHIWSNSVEKFEALEWPLLEVRRFFQ